MKTKAYSYIRFSSPEQLKGDSLRRQLEASEKYASDNNLDLVTEYQDLGVSAFRGSNASIGALSAFIDSVKAGKIARGSILLIESLDRLSREKAKTALARFIDLLDLGIEVVTLMDGKRYTENADQMDLMYSLMVMGRAHEESKTKSERVRKAWENKREEAQKSGKPLTSQCPAWIELMDGEYKLIPDRAKVIEGIFESISKGSGKGSIIRKLNSDDVKPWGGGAHWHASYIDKIIKSHSVFGEFQPRTTQYNSKALRIEHLPDGPPIENYYPAVISREQYFKAISKRAKPVVSSGRRGKTFSNLFTGLVKCSKCGSSMIMLDKGKKPKGLKYLACSSKHSQSGCDAKNIRYEPFERSMLGALMDLDHSMILPDEQAHESKVSELVETQSSLEKRIDDLTSKINYFVKAIGEGSPPDALTNALKIAEQDKNILESELSSVTEELHDSLALEDGVDELKESIRHSSIRVFYALDQLGFYGGDKELYHLREQLNSLYSRFINSIDINGDDEAWKVNLSSSKELGLYFVTERETRTIRKDGKVVNKPFVLKKGYLEQEGSDNINLEQYLNFELERYRYSVMGTDEEDKYR